VNDSFTMTLTTFVVDPLDVGLTMVWRTINSLFTTPVRPMIIRTTRGLTPTNMTKIFTTTPTPTRILRSSRKLIETAIGRSLAGQQVTVEHGRSWLPENSGSRPPREAAETVPVQQPSGVWNDIFEVTKPNVPPLADYGKETVSFSFPLVSMRYVRRSRRFCQPAS
jgi:hypothetical protein